MKRILFCINSLQGGGAERVVLNLSKELQGMGHYVHLILLDESKGYEPTFDLPLETLFYKKRGQNNVKKLQELINTLEKEKNFDLIVSHLPRTDKLLSSINHSNLYFCIHTTFSKAYIDNKSWFKKIRRKLRYKNRYNNKNIITVSQGVALDFVTKMGIKPASIGTIYNPFNLNEIRESAKEKNTLDKEKYIISVANFGRVKRHDILLKAYKESKVGHKLILVGKNLKENLRMLVTELGIEEKVVFLDFVENPYPLIKGAHALVLSSEFEGLGNVLIEALILGTNVISTDCDSGPREILVDELKSNLIPVNDITALAEKISNVSKKEKEVLDYSKYLKKFDARYAAEEYLKLIK